MTLPHNRANLVDADGRPTRDWYDWFRRLGEIFDPKGTAFPSLSLNNLSNTAISSPVDGDALVWDDTVGRWVNGASGGGGGYAEGTSFPGSPASGDKFYRTDLNWLCFYDGTRWLTCHEYEITLTSPNQSTAGDWTFSRAALRADRQIYLTTCHTTTWHITAPSALNFWTIDVSTYNASRTRTTLFSFATSSYASGMVARSDTLNTAVATTQLMIEGRIVETGGAPNVLVSHTVYYRVIVT